MLKQAKIDRATRIAKKLAAVLFLIVILVIGKILFQILLDSGFNPGNSPEIFGQPAGGELWVQVIDIGQGDSILIRSVDKTILIDAGPGSSEQDLKAFLDSCGVKTIDCFICSHHHEDHIGGADMVMTEYNVKQVLMPMTDSSTYAVTSFLDSIYASNAVVDVPAPGDDYTFGDISFTVLAPENKFKDGNNSSIVILLTYGDTRFMFTGDAETESEKEILKRFDGTDLECDFLKVGHHGSTTSTGSKFLSTVSPSVAAISCGRDNDYGHPHSKIIKRLINFGISEDNILRTDIDGTLTIISDGSSLSIIL